MATVASSEPAIQIFKRSLDFPDFERRVGGRTTKDEETDMAAGDTEERRGPTTVAPGPSLATASTFLEGLAVQDYARLGAALAPDVRLRALLPGGPREWTGAATVAHRFARWFGDTERHELQDSGIDQVLGRIHLRWRLRLQAARLGAGWFVVEQLAYADAGEDGRIAGLDLLCTGYLPEPSDD